MPDAISQAQVWRVLQQAAEIRKLGILVISHNPKLLDRVCTRTVTMQELSS